MRGVGYTDGMGTADSCLPQPGPLLTCGLPSGGAWQAARDQCAPILTSLYGIV